MSRVQCKPGEVRNPYTGRCVKRNGDIGRLLIEMKSPAYRRRATRDSSDRPAMGRDEIFRDLRKGCPSTSSKRAVYNPLTGNCIKASSKTAVMMYKIEKGLRQDEIFRLTGGRRSGSGDSIVRTMLPDCPPGKIRNPATGRCVNRDGKLGQSILSKRRMRRL